MATRESVRERTMQARQEAQHSGANAFVKRTQGDLAKFAGKAPELRPEAQEFNAYMCNNGENAQEFARKLTQGFDKTAFPVK